MKVRNGFVSNSSSSSFVVMIKTCKCPTCNLNPVQHLLNLLERDHYETELDKRQTIPEWLEEKAAEIRIKEKDIEGHKKFPPEEVINNYWSQSTTHGMVIGWLEKDIKDLQEEERKVLNHPEEFNEVCTFSIGYHDEGTEELYEALKEAGYLIEIEACR